MSSTHDPLLDSVPGRPPEAFASSLALLARARQGDREAQDGLFRRYEEPLQRIIRVRIGAHLRRFTESGDLLQETFRAALRSLPEVEPESEFDFLDWLSRIATNRIRDLWDHVQAQKRGLDRVRELDLLPADAVPRGMALDSRAQAPSELAFKAEVRALLDETLATLPESYREVILLRDYLGASWEETQNKLGGMSLHAIQQLHQRAWIKVRAAAAPKLAGLRGS